MLEQYNFFYYLSSFIGLVPFSYQIKNNETIIFSFPKKKIAYSIFMFLSLTIYIILQLFIGCQKFVVTSILSSMTFIGFLMAWIISYLNIFFYSMKLTNVLKSLHKFEQIKKPPKSRNTLFIGYSISICTAFVIFCSETYMNDDSSGLHMPNYCFYAMFVEYVGNMTSISTFIFTLTEVRHHAIEWQKILINQKIKTSYELRKYTKYLTTMKDIYYDINSMSDIPMSLVLLMGLINMLLSFYYFLKFGLFQVRSDNLLFMLKNLYTPLLWFVHGWVCIVAWVFYISKCGSEIQKLSDMISSSLEEIDSVYNQVN